jgi:hypothetical protein
MAWCLFKRSDFTCTFICLLLLCICSWITFVYTKRLGSGVVLKISIVYICSTSQLCLVSNYCSSQTRWRGRETQSYTVGLLPGLLPDLDCTKIVTTWIRSAFFPLGNTVHRTTIFRLSIEKIKYLTKWWCKIWLLIVNIHLKHFKAREKVMKPDSRWLVQMSPRDNPCNNSATYCNGGKGKVVPML